jgi:hypothetical protein
MKPSLASLVAVSTLAASCDSHISNLSDAQTPSKRVNFSIKTSDSITSIQGQIDLPTAVVGSTSKPPVVVMVGGTGLFDRDYLWGISGTERDLLFKEFAKSLNQMGIAAARYDYRGVKCNIISMPACPDCKTEVQRLAYFRKTCFDEEIRKSVTPITTQQDALEVYKYVQSYEGIDPSKIVVLAHSEGTIHVSRLVGQKAIAPHALLMLGAVAESPQSIIHWQAVDREVEDMFAKFDLNSGGTVTNAEIDTVCENSPGDAEKCKEDWRSSSGNWTKQSFREHCERVNYAPAKAEALQHADHDPYVDSGIVMASYAWWKMWFTDNRTTLPDLFGFPGKISFNNGEIDSQTPGERELGLVEENRAQFKAAIRANLYRGVGHGFGEHPTFGPVNEHSWKKILEELNWLLE